jgi:hypothetical protein
MTKGSAVTVNRVSPTRVKGLLPQRPRTRSRQRHGEGYHCQADHDRAELNEPTCCGDCFQGPTLSLGLAGV